MSRGITEEEKLITSQERQLITNKYKRLIRLLGDISPEEKKQLKEAFKLAYRAHEKTRRRCGIPYIIHPLRVCLILVEDIGIRDMVAIVCALMHDVVEDTGITLEEIDTRFGNQVKLILDALTKIKEPRQRGYHATYHEAMNFKKIFSLFVEDKRICPIKIADRLDNMRSLQALPVYKQLKIANETKAIYAPLAHRLGFGKVKSNLEDLYLKYVHSDIYHQVAKKVQLRRPEREKAIRRFALPIIKELKAYDITFRTEMRVKSIYSIYDKMKRKNMAFEQLHDLFGLRIIIDCPRDKEMTKCWQVYGIVARIYTINPQRTHDWISTPRSNGYESLHMNAISGKSEWVEVQIRSQRMHEVATQGVAAHWKYKGDAEKKVATVINYEELISEMSALAKQESNATEAVEDAQLALYDRDICVFTEVGKRIFLPQGATLLDYAIQTMDKKGVYCKKAIVDGKMQSKYYQLKNGEQINDLHINLRQKLQPEWATLTHTPKARKVWREVFSHFSATKHKKGKKIVEKKLAEKNIPLSSQVEQQLKNFFKQASLDHVYYKIGNETIPKEMMQEFIKMREQEESQRKRTRSSRTQAKRHINITGEESEDYELAPCCTALPGDRVFGIVPHSKSIIDIHRLDCPEAPSLISHYGSSFLEVSWRHTDQSFERCISLTGIINSDAKKEIVLLLQNFDVLSFILKKESIRTKGIIMVNVHSVQEMTDIMERLKKVVGILDVTRDYVPNSNYLI